MKKNCLHIPKGTVSNFHWWRQRKDLANGADNLDGFMKGNYCRILWAYSLPSNHLKELHVNSLNMLFNSTLRHPLHYTVAGVGVSPIR